jgi:ubiquinone/menaquinone biosynthesis C-methylase UbiE
MANDSNASLPETSASDTPAPSPPGPMAQAHSWDLVSRGYEKYTREFLAKYSHVGLERLGLERSHRLLDVACGPGTTSLLARERVQSIQAVDFSPEMVSIFKGHISSLSASNVQVQVADGQNLPFEDHSFERAVSMFGLTFFPDRLRGMQEMHRVLVPGGRVLISSWAPVDLSPLMQTMFAAGRAANPNAPLPQRNLETLENPTVFESSLKQAGFEEIEITPCLCTNDYSSGGQLWDEMVEGAIPLMLLKNSMSPEAWDGYSRICRDFLERDLADGRPLGSTAYLATATKVP